MSFRYPCTGHIGAEGFGAWAEEELGEPRRNLHLFARSIRESLGCEFVSLTNSGSSANLGAAVALREFGGAKARALTAGFTFPTTLSSLEQAGWEVELVDTEPGGFNLDPDALERRLDDRVGLICVTHFLGFPAQLARLSELAASVGALLLQDGCDTMGLRVEGKPIHDRGGLVTHSFYHPHHLPAHGGGAICSNDEELARIVESTISWGRSCSHQSEQLPCPLPEGPGHFFTYERPGFNVQMSELNACFGRFSMRSAEQDEQRRLSHYGTLRSALADHPRLRTWELPDSGCSPGVFPVQLRTGDPASLLARLAARGVEARTLLGGVMAEQAAFEHLPHDGLRHCREVSASTVFVGIHQSLPSADVEAVARILVEEGGA